MTRPDAGARDRDSGWERGRARGRLIAFEGGEGCGKTTQAALLAARLGAVLTREPGGTAMGERVRGLLLDPALAFGPAGLDPRAEALLMAAARAQHVAEVVAPALEAGRDVVTDRFSHSSLAYQGYGRGLDLDDLRWISGWATAGTWPDAVVLLEVPPSVAADRVAGRQAVAGRRAPDRTEAPDRMEALDRIEAEDDRFHERVVVGFGELAEADPSRWSVVDGVGPVDEVAERVWVAVEGLRTGGGVRIEG